MAFGTLGEAIIQIRPSMAGFQSTLTQGLVNSVEGTLRTVGETVENLGKTLLKRFAIPLGIAVAANITQFQALDAQIRETLTLFGSGGTGVVTKQFDEMRDGIFEVSEAVGVLEQGVSEGLYQALSAGVPRDNVFDFLETAQKAAVGGGIDLLTTVDGLTTATNAFAASGLTAGDAADILFRGVARGKTTLGELSVSMARVAPIVAATGTEFDEFIALISTMTLSGTGTAEAMSSLKAAISGVLRPTEELNAVWSDLGFTSAETAMQTLGMQGVFQAVSDSVDGSTTGLIELIGNIEGVNGILQVTGENAGRFASVMGDTGNATGAMAQAFETMQGGVGRAFGRMTAAFDRLGNVAGALASGFVAPLVDAITGVVSTLAGWVKTISEALRPVQAAWKVFIETLTGNTVFKTVASLIVSFVVAIGTLGAALGLVITPLGLFLRAMVGLRALSVIGPGFKLVTSGLTNISEALSIAGTRLSNYGKIAGAAGGKISGLGAGFSKLAGLMAPGPFLAVTAAVAALTIGIIKMNEAHDGVQTLERVGCRR